MSEQTTPTVDTIKSEQTERLGAAIVKARQQRHWSVEDVSKRLRMDVWMVKAIEADDWEALGAPVFAKGHARQYVQLLKLPETLLDERDWSGQPQPSLRPARMSVTPNNKAHIMTAKVMSWLSVLVVAALLVGGVTWAIRADLLSRWSTLWPWGATSSVSKDSQSLVLPTEAQATQTNDQAIDAGTVDALPASSSDEVDLSVEASLESAIDIAPTPPVADPVLVFRFAEDTWAEVYDANDQRILFALQPAGTSQRLTAKPPFDIVLGQSRGVTLTWQGEPVSMPGSRTGKAVRFKVPTTN